MSDRDEGAREQVQQRPVPERAPAAPAVEGVAPSVVPTTEVRGAPGGMRATLEGMDAVSRHRMVSDMQRRAGNVAVQRALGQHSAAPAPQGLVQRGRSAAPAPAAPSRTAAEAPAGGAGYSPDGAVPERARAAAALDALTGRAGGGHGRPAPVAGGGGSGVTPPSPPGPPEAGPRFTPSGLGGGEAPEDLTPLDDAAVDALLAALWDEGVFRGDAERLAALLPRVTDAARGREVRAFALLAALQERSATRALDLDPEDGPPAVAALWGIASSWRTALLPDGGAGAAPDLDALVAAAAAADPERAAALAGWAAIARAEAAGVAGEAAVAKDLLRRTAEDPEVPPGCAVAAGTRAATLDAFVDPGAARSRLAAAAHTARARARAAAAGHVEVRHALVALLDADGAAAREALGTVDAARLSPEDVALAAALAGVAAGRPDLGTVRAVAEDAAAWGDYLAAAGLLVVAARACRRAGGGAAVDAVTLLFGGISLVTRAFGPGTAGPLEFERDAIASGLGPEGFKAAMRSAIERMERGLGPRTGPVAPPA